MSANYNNISNNNEEGGGGGPMITSTDGGAFGLDGSYGSGKEKKTLSHTLDSFDTPSLSSSPPSEADANDMGRKEKGMNVTGALSIAINVSVFAVFPVCDVVLRTLYIIPSYIWISPNREFKTVFTKGSWTVMLILLSFVPRPFHNHTTGLHG